MSAETFQAKPVEAAILQLDKIPQLPGTPPFPWDTLAKKLEEVFDIQGLSLEASAPEWRKQRHVTSNLGSPRTAIYMVAPPLEGSFTWLMADRDYRQILSWVLLKQDGPPPKVDADLQEGFTRFVGLEVMHHIEQLNFVEDLVLRQSSEEEASEGPFLCVDVTASYHDQKVMGRIALSSDFVESWRQRYDLKLKRRLPKELAQQIELPVSIQVGGTELSQSEWQNIAVGDLIIADSCTIQPETGAGKATVALNGRAFFSGSLSNGKVTIENSL